MISSESLAPYALESFFLERYRVYEWLVFHPMVLRADIALTRALVILLEIFFREIERDGKEADGIREILKAAELDRLWKSLESQS